MRRAKIIATLGPASESAQAIRQLVEAGVNVFRLNFSHGTIQDHRRRIEQVRRVSTELGMPVAILQDLPGPKLRTGNFPSGAVTLKEGDEVLLTGREIAGSAEIIPVNYPRLTEDVTAGSHILMDDGRLELEVVGAKGPDLRCRVIDGGELKDRKGVNFPDVPLSLPSITMQDEKDLAFGLGLGVDYVALSFVRQAKDVREARRLIIQEGQNVPLIAKIEKPQAIDDLEAILEASDGVMVARGDLGVEMPPEQVPILQKRIIEYANASGRLVIVATQMLESMMANPRPTRAEASDVANAVIDGTDAVMLSGETAVGMYPAEAVQMMARIIVEAERSGRHGDLGGSLGEQHAAPTDAHAISHAVREIAQDMELQAIIAFTQSGFTARLISKDRPCCPILAMTPNEAVYRQLALVWGVTPILSPFVEDSDEMIAVVEKVLVDRGYVEPKHRVVIMGGLPVTTRGLTNFLKIHTIRGASDSGN